MREAGLEEELEAFREISRETSLPRLGDTLQSLDRDITSWTTPPAITGNANDESAPASETEVKSGADAATEES
jgi:hypothetical protein